MHLKLAKRLITVKNQENYPNGKNVVMAKLRKRPEIAVKMIKTQLSKLSKQQEMRNDEN